MLSDYINSCESIRKDVGNNGTSGGQGSGDSGGGGSSTSQQSDGCSTETSAASTTCPTTTSCPATGTQTSNCQQPAAVQPSKANQCNTVQQQQIQTPAKNNNECSFKVFCEKVKNGTCNVLKEIECKECKECTGSEEICKKFISVTMEQCEKEAECLIMQLNEDLSPELLNTIVLRFIGLLLYLRIIQEFSLLREYFTKIIENLSTCYNTIKSCTCGSGNRCCSVEGKCVCTIFYKLFKATVSLHDRYCKIINYIRGECDEDLYKVIPSLSLTRSIILLTSYFNDYINSDYMVEESSCGCGKNVYIEPSLIGHTSTFVFNMLLLLLSKVINKTEYIGLRTCPCHKYSSKLDDVVTLLQTGIEDTDDCDGILSDVISMISPLVKFEYAKDVTLKTEPSQDNKTQIDKQLQEVNNKKDGLNTVITGINGDSNCDGATVGSGGGGTGGATCGTCSDTTADTQGTTTSCGGTDDGKIETACSQFMNGGTNGCGPTQCECKCDTCKTKPGQCCCFFKCTSCDCETADTKSKDCLKNLVGLLKADDIKCNGSDDSNVKDCLMCYLCVLKSSICKLKDACTVNSDASNGNGCNLHDTLQNLPTNIETVVGKICGNTTSKECCKNCTEKNGCSDNDDGTCKCNGDKKCCEVNDRYSNFTKFLLGTCATTSSTENNNCKTIADTLIQLNGTLNKFIGGNSASTQNGGTNCQCTCNGSNCTNKCCCGKPDCKDNGCTGTEPIKILSCVIECGLKGIKNRSDNIVKHIESIVKCLECIQTKMKKLEGCYCGLHKNISVLGQCVKDETDCLRTKICKLKTGKVENQEKFNEVITSSREVLSDICGLYGVYSIESYSYSLSPYYIPIFPHNKQFILPCINN